MNIYNALKDTFKYFTSWIILFVVFHKYTNNILNLRLLTILTFIGGFYISFIYPNYYLFKISGIQVNVHTLLERCITEFFLHFMLLLVVLLLCSDSYDFLSYQTLNSLMFIIVYLMVLDVRIIYNLRKQDMLNIFIVSLIVYTIVTL
jgi:hypothetical protein